MPSICKQHMKDRKLVRKVAEAYRKGLDTVGAVADRYGVNHVTAREMIRRHMSDEEFDRFKSLRYRKSKVGKKNPMYGKRTASDCEDGRGYLTRLVDGRRHYVQRIVAAEMLGIPITSLPESIVVHHIDEDPMNNHPDNLALTNRMGHSTIHERYQLASEDLLLKRSTVREAIEHMTSR